jgi:hypothetical protein
MNPRCWPSELGDRPRPTPRAPAACPASSATARGQPRPPAACPPHSRPPAANHALPLLAQRARRPRTRSLRRTPVQPGVRRTHRVCGTRTGRAAHTRGHARDTPTTGGSRQPPTTQPSLPIRRTPADPRPSLPNAAPSRWVHGGQPRRGAQPPDPGGQPRAPGRVRRTVRRGGGQAYPVGGTSRRARTRSLRRTPVQPGVRRPHRLCRTRTGCAEPAPGAPNPHRVHRTRTECTEFAPGAPLLTRRPRAGTPTAGWGALGLRPVHGRPAAYPTGSPESRRTRLPRVRRNARGAPGGPAGAARSSG